MTLEWLIIWHELSLQNTLHKLRQVNATVPSFWASVIQWALHLAGHSMTGVGIVLYFEFLGRSGVSGGHGCSAGCRSDPVRDFSVCNGA